MNRIAFFADARPLTRTCIATSSETGILRSSHLPDYSATKGAINAFTKALAMNPIEKGMRVNAVAPGPVWTPLNPSDSGLKPDQAQEVGRTRFEAAGIGAKHHLFLRDEVGVTHIVPAVNGWIQFFLKFASDVKNSRAAGAEQPFVRVGGEKIHIFYRRRKCAEGLDRIEAE